MRKTAVLLDAGGVLLDETQMESALCDAVVAMLQRLFPGYSERDYWTDVEESVQRYASSTPRYVLWKRCSGDVELYERLVAEYLPHQRAACEQVVLMEGIGEELNALAERFELVYAGQYGPPVFELLDRHGIARLFVNRLSQADFTVTKPDPRYLQQIAERAGLRCQECIAVGDRIDKDVIPARQNGMGSVLVRTGIHRSQTARVPEEMPDIDLPHVKGMADAILERWGSC